MKRAGLAVVAVMVALTVRTARAQSAPVPNTFVDLQSVALNQADIPDYLLKQESESSVPHASATYTALWMASDGSGASIDDQLIAMPTAADGDAFLQAFLHNFLNSAQAVDPVQQPAPSLGLGTAQYTFAYTSDTGSAPACLTAFNQDGIVMILANIGSPFGTTSTVACRDDLATAVDSRIQAFETMMAVS